VYFSKEFFSETVPALLGRLQYKQKNLINLKGFAAQFDFDRLKETNTELGSVFRRGSTARLNEIEL